MTNGWLRGTYLSRLSPAVGGKLLKLGTTRRIPLGDQLIRQGERESDIFLLTAASSTGSACVKVSVTSADGSSVLLAIRMRGDVVGEGAGFRSDGTRGATVTACSDIRVQSITREKFDGFLQEHAEAALALCALLTERQDFANRRRLDFAAFNVQIRLARLIHELALTYGIPSGAGGAKLDFELSQEELGKLIGAKPDSVNKALGMLRAEGLIQTRYLGVSVPDLVTLRRASELE